jgi:acyl-CoA reductase-like NAD-dependent aldehyde dehydrogenase
MAAMTTITPATPATDADFSGTGTITNPATGAVAGQVQWTDAADVPTIAAGLRAAQHEWEQRGAQGRNKALAPEKRPAALPFMAIKKITVHYRPRPVVGIIAPWNYPVANALMDGLGALAAGCAVLLKPSERTPLTAEVLRRGWQESGGPEVFELAQGARAVSEAVIDNVDYLQFTGSSATGSKVMERADRRLTPVSTTTIRSKR